ncbi:hydroxymethylglutaryl-CoA synthase [Patescibacteria group bacterium]|nr:hydroxymethylglutaryl-CoA synthase [Patescibacteria group bacterium]MBU1472196.1 hydroxymethylglutaryl-CoA synthase [Patescibacteria group bacterium]MBU2459590.1 hydroxymethylglutaryl-CoA synthase [Patescibacteria group bacterium]MBU2544169.1 hydroxymethylglutaryl-CoA synthase [Patescibacteria group bacterium]
MVGIVSYGTYIPRYRIKIADIAAAWKKDPDEVIRSLGVLEKSVPGGDEDTATIAIEAASSALGACAADPKSIECIFVGSESHPYAVNPTSTIVGELLGVGHNYLAADLEFACKAGTSGMQAISGLIEAGQIRYGMAIGADTAQSKPHDVLEYTSAAAGAAFLLGRNKLIAKLVSYTSYSSDTPDFWRRDGIRYPSHAGRFTGEPAYFAHVAAAARRLMEKAHCRPEDIDWCVFHMPNGKFPRAVAKRLGFSHNQLAPSLIVDTIGNPYSASTMLGLAAVLDIAKPGEKIFMVSYGSGAGSDAFLWETTEEVVSYQRSAVRQKKTVKDQIERKTYIDYVQYLKQTHKI